MPTSARPILALALIALAASACDGSPTVGGSPADGGAASTGGMRGTGGISGTGSIFGTGGSGARFDAPLAPAIDGAIEADAPLITPDGGVASGLDTASIAVDTSPAPSCRAVGQLCSSGADCCSTVCDPTTNTCVASINKCTAAGGSCVSSTECCSLSCTAGRCSAGSCIGDGNACTDGAACCSGTCTGGLCKALNTACRTAGNPCTQGSQCCSSLCKEGVCKLGASFCIQTGDACTDSNTCCSGDCQKSSGALGTCAPPPSGTTNCSDGVDGTVCSDCNGCCSRLCAPYAPSGVRICQPASGCRVNGDLCRKDSDCCGAAGSGLPGDGNVTCEIPVGKAVGICRNPRSCSPQGDVCHYKDYACGSSSSRNNCCGGTGNSGVCQLDTLGIPRCSGIATCRAAGETCSSAIDCCNQMPCVPDGTGQLRCFVPPMSSVDGGVPVACVPFGGPCSINADCCVGSTCIQPVGSTEGVCGIPGTPPGTPEGPDGGTGEIDGPTSGPSPDGPISGPNPDGPTSNPNPDAPTWVCAQYGQLCTTDADCCNGITCWNGRCMDQIVP